MVRELHPAGTHDEDSGTGSGRRPERSGALADDPTATRDSEALPDAATTLPAPPQPPGDALDEPPSAVAAAPSTSTSTRHLPSTDFVVTHPSQTRFTCPACKLTYTTHHSLVRHVGVSHARLNLNITFQCALCEYVNTNLRATANHYRLAHGAAVPPRDVIGSDEKACPFCPRTFPSTRSCAQHIREQHMELASAQRAREAADKEAQRGTTTAGTKWGEGEIGRFKEALARLGPNDNAKLAEAVGTRDKAQVSAFKCRFLKRYPTWLKDHRPPDQRAATNTSGSPTPNPTSYQATADRRPPSTRTGSRTRPAGTMDTRARSGRTTSSPISPTPTPPGYVPPASAGALPLTTEQHGSLDGEVVEQPSQTQTSPATATQEEGTPSPQPAPISAEAARKLQCLDQMLDLLRNNRVERWEPVPQDPSPLAQDEMEVATTNRPDLREGTAPPTTATPTDQIGEQGPLNREAALDILGMDNITLWDPEEELLSPTLLAGLATPPSAPPLPDTDRQRSSLEGSMADQTYSAAIVQPAPTSTFPLATATEGQYSDPGEEEVDRLLQEPVASSEEAPVPPPTTLRSCINAQPFVPGTPWASERVQRLDQVLRTLRGVAPTDTSLCPTPPSSPQHTPPPATVSERQHCSPAGDVEATQALVTSPARAEAIPPTPPTSPGLPPRPARVPCTTINIDTENMDQTLRQPFYEELLPFAGRRLGDYEWIAFETVLERWTKAIKEVVTAPRRRPPNRTSQWAQRRRRRGQEEQEDRPPYPAQDLPTDPADEQAQTPTTTNNRASGRARRAAKARHLQKLYRANPGVCMRRLLEGDTPPVYCAIAEPELVAHFSAALSTPLPLGPPPVWLFPDRHPGETGLPGTPDEGDILQSPVTPEEVVTQFKRTKRTAPGIDGITYASWRWVDPQGLTLSTIYNICRVNSRVPRPWKHSTVTLIHKGGDTATIRNWRPISLQVTIYKLYSALIARRIASWAIATQAFSSAQKGFLAFDGCAEHNFILRSMMTDARRSKRDLLLTWLDLRDAFGSVPHELLLSTMKCLGLSGSILHIVEDIYSQSTVAIRTGKDTYTPAISRTAGSSKGAHSVPFSLTLHWRDCLNTLPPTQQDTY